MKKLTSMPTYQALADRPHEVSREEIEEIGDSADDTSESGQRLAHALLLLHKLLKEHERHTKATH
jgi:hypothetical protein